MTNRCLRGDQLDANDVYGIWKIRDAVFAFEQHVEDVDVDDLDLRADTIHLWSNDESGPTSYLRILDGDGYLKIGRVCTRKDMRGQGLAGRLMTEVSTRFGDGILKLNAQAYLERWYEGFGYVRSGDNFDEAGIDHVPMIRTVQSPRFGR
ncbi:MAG: GNAT family N-acetyltransferase [Kineosporiaceae bacterium]|nr:GNAT family N-acetyltransferase [Aeromicrobium sp.]